MESLYPLSPLLTKKRIAPSVVFLITYKDFSKGCFCLLVCSIKRLSARDRLQPGYKTH